MTTAGRKGAAKERPLRGVWASVSRAGLARRRPYSCCSKGTFVGAFSTAGTRRHSFVQTVRAVSTGTLRNLAAAGEWVRPFA